MLAEDRQIQTWSLATAMRSEPLQSKSELGGKGTITKSVTILGSTSITVDFVQKNTLRVWGPSRRTAKVDRQLAVGANVRKGSDRRISRNIHNFRNSISILREEACR